MRWLFICTACLFGMMLSLQYATLHALYTLYVAIFVLLQDFVKTLADLCASVKTFDDYQNFLPKNNIKQGHLRDPFMPVAEVRQKLDQIKGHLVWMPLDFLEGAEMAEKGLQLNAYTESIYT